MLRKLNISEEQFIVLNVCKQQKLGENLEYILQKYSNQVVELRAVGMIKEIKGRKNQTELSKLRLADAGEEVLKKAALFEVDPEAKNVFDKIKTRYLEKDNRRKIGQESEVLWLMTWFSKETGFTYPQIIYLLSLYMKKEEYTLVFQYIFYKDSSKYYSKPVLGRSNLWNFYLQNEDMVKRLWREKNVIEE